MNYAPESAPLPSRKELNLFTDEQLMENYGDLFSPFMIARKQGRKIYFTRFNKEFSFSTTSGPSRRQRRKQHMQSSLRGYTRK